jgi:GntR family transcriptional regulator
MAGTLRFVKEDEGTPLYRQVEQALRAEIAERWQPGEAIPTEAELERRFGVSRITIRRAVHELVQAGLLSRRQGSGTFVARAKVTEELGVLHSWPDEMRIQGLEPRTVDCEMLQIVPPAWVVQALRLDADAREHVLRVQRLQYNGDEPLCLMIDHLRVRFVPSLPREDVMARGLYETLEKRHGLTLAWAEDTVTARTATVFETALLGITNGDPVLQVTRTVYLADDEPLDAAIVVSRADRYAYHVTGRPRRLTGPGR